MSENPLYNFFPKTDKIVSMRTNQREALDKIWINIEKGVTKHTIAAPTGAGKSAIADTLFNYYISLGLKCLYCSPMNNLVDQFEDSKFEDVCTIKGRDARNSKTGNPAYPCLAKMGLSCSEGFCQSDKCPSKRKRDCRNKPYDTCKICICWSCIYKGAFKKFRESSKGNTNFSLMLLGVDNSPDVIVLDECDTAEQFIRGHYGVTIPRLINDQNFKHHIEPLQSYLEEIGLLIELIDPMDDNTTDLQLKERKLLVSQFDKINTLLMDFETNSEPWVITVNLEKQKTKYEPVTIDRFLDPLLEGKIVFMMSATPPKFPGYTMIEVDSSFPINTRTWSYHPIGKMSLDHRDKTIPALAWWLSELKGKTLVHCLSYATAKKISDALRILDVYPLLQTNGHNEFGNDDEHCISRYDAVEAFVTAKDPDKILLSVKLDRGIDLWQPDILNNVIAVLPFANPTDPLTKAKRKYLPEGWEEEEMARTIAQMMGRIFRSEKLGVYNGKPIPKRGYIVASEWRRFYVNNKKLFPLWFRESQVKEV